MSEAERFALSSTAPIQLPRVPTPLSTNLRKRTGQMKTKSTEPSVLNDPKDHNFSSTIKKLRKISAAINWLRSCTRDF